MVATGCLFSWVLVGADPMPRRPSLVVRVGLLVVVASAHDVLARLLYARAGDADDPAGVRTGAQLMAYGSAVVDVLLAVALMAAWYRAGGRRLAAERRREGARAAGVTAGT